MSEHFEFKVVVAGAFGAGKTTLITAITDGRIVGTEAPTSGAEAALKDTTTVGMEYGTFVAPGGHFTVDLNLYGVPGQRRFSFMWDIVGVGMDGLILLVDATQPETWNEAAEVATYFQDRHAVPTVIGVNRAIDPERAIADVERAVVVPGGRYVPCNPTDPMSAKDTLIELLFALLDTLPDEGEELGEGDQLVEIARQSGRRATDVPAPEVDGSRVAQLERER